MTSVEEIVQYLAKLIVTVARSERNVRTTTHKYNLLTLIQ